MRNNILYILILFVFAFAKAQSPSADLLTSIQGASTTDINTITGAQQGMLVYDNTINKLKQYNGTSWVTVEEETSTVILNREGGNNVLQTNTNTFSDFPLTDANTQANTGSAFTVETNGHITINEDGQYLISGALSSSNFPQGTRKYIISAWRNGGQIGYLSRGFVTQPNPGNDFWGTSGTLIYTLSAGDDIAFRYVINNNGNTLNLVFANASITKL